MFNGSFRSDYITYCHDNLLGWVLQIDVSGDEKTFLVAVGLLILDPDRGLGVIGLLLVGPLHIQRWKKELRGVGIDRPLHKFDMARHVEAEICSWILKRIGIRKFETK